MLFQSHPIGRKDICWRRTHGSASNILTLSIFLSFSVAAALFVEKRLLLQLAEKVLQPQSRSQIIISKKKKPKTGGIRYQTGTRYKPPYVDLPTAPIPFKFQFF